MQVTVKVISEYATALRAAGAPATAELEDLLRTLAELGISLEPMHPAGTSPQLESYFTADVPDADTDRVLAELRSLAAVEAAYVKPADAPP